MICGHVRHVVAVHRAARHLAGCGRRSIRCHWAERQPERTNHGENELDHGCFNRPSELDHSSAGEGASATRPEREVTGERIRDKVAASKAKGLWMGGNLPLGFDAPDQGMRLLKVSDTEAETFA